MVASAVSLHSLIIGGVINSINLQLYILIIVSENLYNPERRLLLLSALEFSPLVPDTTKLFSKQTALLFSSVSHERVDSVLRPSQLQSNNLICWFSRFSAS